MNANVGLTVGEIFEGLAPETLKDFEALGHKVSYPGGTSLFGAAEPCSGILWASSGQVRVSICDSTGQCVMSRVARAGELVGLKAALCGEACGTTARTEGPCEITFVSRENLSAFLSSHADAAFSIVQRLSTQVGLALDQLRSISTSNPPKPPN